MNLKLMVFCAGLLLLAACRHDKKPTAAANDSVAVKTQPNTGKKNADTDSTTNVAKLLVTYTFIHTFSDPLKKDLFSLALYSDKNSRFWCIFWILDHHRHIIYKDTVDIGDRFVDLDTATFTKGMKEDSTRKFAAHFFDSTNFSRPSIEKSENFQDSFPDADSSEEKEWNEIKADESSVGFSYEIGNESIMTIAFSKKRKKVMVVFYSD